ncbi:MAG: DSD1 family PLP-dependent enzyme [Planctomycetaceae bacterium]|nr:DSD1 family PLP-dependent enzyme [Planctomycetaceae bacterium]
MPTPPLGCSKDDLDTPALCLDLDVMDENIRLISAACRAKGVNWRPHVKGHKVGSIGKAEVDAGALGLTCAKLAEAEIMAAAGVKDLLIANIVVGPHKMARLVELRKIADPIVTVDHIDQVLPVSRAFQPTGMSCRVIIEVDIGLGRVGVLPGEPTLQLAQQIRALPGITFAGIMGYEGHLLTIADPVEKQTQIHEALDRLVTTKQMLEANGCACPIVSCAGSGSYQISITHPGITEVQAGGAIFMDVFYREKCGVQGLGNALTLVTTVNSRPAPDRAIIDAGRKSMNIEVDVPQIKGRPDIAIERLSAEHGQLKLQPSAQSLKIGDRLEIIPGYEDLTVALHDQFYAFRSGKLAKIIPIEGRGKLT